jgi:hypothetical protein
MWLVPYLKHKANGCFGGGRGGWVCGDQAQVVLGVVGCLVSGFWISFIWKLIEKRKRG